MRITIHLRQDEHEALWCVAERERRDPRDQAALIIRRELERAGLLKSDNEQPRDLAQAVHQPFCE